ncbi:MAG: hypothetical protein V2I38_15190 [Alcanivoracaceae bacterium]|jgi:hypothetical protein|nr:hypothetical protein [Alcanivoracaceae bacterium]
MLESLGSDEQKRAFLDDFVEHYITRQGLGGISKTDLDALIVHSYVKHGCGGKVDAYSLAETFKIKESRVKSLIDLAWIKYMTPEESSPALVWLQILGSLASVNIELESLEKGQIRFKLSHPAHFRYFQKEVRLLGSTASYSPSSEQVVMSFKAFNKVIDRAHDKYRSGDNFNEPVKAIYRHIRNDVIGPERFESYASGPKKNSALGNAITLGGSLASIGALIADVFFTGGAAATGMAMIQRNVTA